MNKKVALIYPYFLTNTKTPVLFSPLGIASLASQIKALNIETKQFDCTFADFDEIIKEIIAFNPAIIGIYIMTTFFIWLLPNTSQTFDIGRAWYTLGCSK